MSEGPVRSLIMGSLNRGEDSLLLKDIVHNNIWDWLSFIIPATFLQKIKATPTPIVVVDVDQMSWSSSPNGDFELKEAYRLACLKEGPIWLEIFMRSWVWKVLTLLKIKCFIWQCAHQSILVRAILTARGFNLPSTCPLCNKATESIIHALRDFLIVRLFWNSFPPPIQSNLFYVVNLGD